jgi:autotransporter-associated beta strand protein
MNASADDKTWTGAQNGTWDTVTTNWSLGSTATTFSAGDGATFGASATTNVTLSGTQQAAVVVFNSDSNYVLTSSTATQSTSASVGLSVATRFEKRGTGTLTMNGMHGFAGNVEVVGGTLKVGSGTTDQGAARNSPLGDPRTPRTITVYTNATLALAGTGTFGAGTAGSDVLADLCIRGGTLKLGSGTSTGLGNLLLSNATLELNGGAVNWPTITMNGSWLEFACDDPMKPYVITGATGSNNGFFLGRTRPIDVRVPDITTNSDPDVTFNVMLKDVVYSGVCAWPSGTNMVKTGAGMLVFACCTNTFCRDLVVSNGVLKCTGNRAQIGGTASCLGDPTKAHTMHIEKAGALILGASDLQGQFYNDSKITIRVKGGALKQVAKVTNGLGPLILDNAAVEYSGNNGWPTLGFSDVTFSGTNAYTLPAVDGSVLYFGANRMSNVYVDNIVSGGSYTGAEDVTIASLVGDCSQTADWLIGGHGPRPCRFRKTGPGVLILSNTTNTFTGDVEVTQGVLKLAKTGAVETPASGSLGNLQTGKRVTVYGQGELYVPYGDCLSQFCSDLNYTLTVSNGIVRFADSTVNAFPRLELYDPVFVYTTGVISSGYEDTPYGWGLWAFRYPVTFDGTKPITWPNNGANNLISLGYSSDTQVAYDAGTSRTNIHGKTEFKVKDITGDGRSDVVIGLDVQSLPHWTRTTSLFKNCRWRCGLLKTGGGTLELTGKFSCPEETRIAEGTLLFGGLLREQVSGWGVSTMRVQSGAYLGGSGTVSNVVVEAGGGFAASVGQTAPLTIAGTLTVSDGTVPVEITNIGDSAVDIQALDVPVVKASNIGTLVCSVKVNGQDTPTNKNWRYVTYVKDGVLRCRGSFVGLLIRVR